MLFLTLACTSSHNLYLDGDVELSLILEERGLDPKQVILPYGLTDEMRGWVRDTVPDTINHPAKLEWLRERLLDPKQMKVEYEWGYTGTAIEVFEQRRANCLSFTNLFVGMARELGVPVYFVAVDNTEQFLKVGDLVVVSDHVAVGFGPGLDREIFDFSENPVEDYRQVRRISDLTAIARYHSNRGAEAIQARDMPGALRWLRTAVLIDPNLSNAWVNLGVVLRRLNEWPEAEAAYRKALEINPSVFSAYHNLASLLRLQKREDEAIAYEVALEKSPNRNPFTYLLLGDISRENGRLAEAERYYRRAVNLGRDKAECFAALGHLALQNGDLKTARRMVRQAVKLDPEEPRTQALAGALENPNVTRSGAP